MSSSTIHAVLPDTIYDELRGGILSQVAAPGDTFTESALALRFGVSRPTAKLAIERLVAEGLLRRESHSAARIPELSREDIVDLFENRAIIEGAALSKLAAGGTIPAVALAAHRALQAGADIDAPSAVLDIAFHRALFDIRGWAAYARHRVWDNALYGRIDDTLVELLAIRIAWGYALFLQRTDANFRTAWSEVIVHWM